MSTALAEVDNTALASHRAATNAAGICREAVLKTAIKIQGRRYVGVEGWQTIANSFGCVASAHNVEKVEGGIRAIGQIKRLSDGLVIAEAEGFVGDDEKTWASRPQYARRAMAQTRAMSRAARSAFAFVITLMDAGLETTPAEEMVGVIDHKPPVEVRPSKDAIFEKAREAIARAESVDRLVEISDRLKAVASESQITQQQLEILREEMAERESIFLEGVAE